PFRGESSGLIFEAILNRTPIAPTRLNLDLPSKLEDIINRALEKDRELRYQHASEMRSELLRLKRDMETGRAASPGSVTVQDATPQSGQKGMPISASVPVSALPSSASVKTPELRISRARKLPWVVVSAAVLVIALG